MKVYIFCDITPRNPVEWNRNLGGTCCLHFQLWRANTKQGARMKQITNRAAGHPLHAFSFLGYSSIFKVELIDSSETSVYFRRIIQRYMQEDITQLNRFYADMLQNLFITLWIGVDEKQNIFITNIHVLPTFCWSRNIRYVCICLCCWYQSFWCLTREDIGVRILANLNNIIHLSRRNLT
jgi:hypothetical protein